MRVYLIYVLRSCRKITFKIPTTLITNGVIKYIFYDNQYTQHIQHHCKLKIEILLFS